MKKALKVLAAALAVVMLAGLTGCISGPWDEAEADLAARELLEAFVEAIEDFDTATIDFMLASGFQLKIYEGYDLTQTKGKTQLMAEIYNDENYQLALRDHGYTMELVTGELLCTTDPEELLTKPVYEQTFFVEELAEYFGLDEIWVSDSGYMKFTLVWDASGEYKLYAMEIHFDADPVVPEPEE
jgi:hypothetical protein